MTIALGVLVGAGITVALAVALRIARSGRRIAGLLATGRYSSACS
jgi:hypothetical protein